MADEGPALEQVDLTPRDGDLLEGQTLVYEQILTYSPEGGLVDTWEQGEPIDDFIRERVARPWLHMDEDVLYSDEAWGEVDENGEEVRGYRVWSQPMPPASGPAPEPPPADGPYLGDAVQDRLDPDAWEDGEVQSFALRLPDRPALILPLRVDPAFASDEEVATRKAERLATLTDRAQAFAEHAGPFIEAVELAGAELTHANALSWRIEVEADHATLVALAEHPALAEVAIAYIDPDAEAETGWGIGDGGSGTRSEWHDYHDRSIYGASGGSGGGAMRVAVLEHTAVRDTACGFKRTVACTGTGSRFSSLYDCEVETPLGNPGSGVCPWIPGVDFCCSTSSPYSNTHSDSGSSVTNYDWKHGNQVSSIIAADYTRGQATGVPMGDVWTGTSCTSHSQCASGICDMDPSVQLCRHSVAWENSATGVAPRAEIDFFGRMVGAWRAQENAIASAIALTGSDIISYSQGTYNDRCEVVHDGTGNDVPQYAEAAFDDGILFVSCAGNTTSDSGSCTTTTCGTWTPASNPKTLAITRFNASATACESDFHDCDRADSNQCDGGADVRVNGTLFSGAASIIDIVGPSSVSHYTHVDTTNYNTGTGNSYTRDNTEGRVFHNATFGGCSAATPHVAGAAALIKEWFMDRGSSWIGSPGRLHTVMLLMTDRAFEIGTSSRLQTGADEEWGLGRLKLRFFGSGSDSAPVRWNVWTNTFAGGSTTDIRWRPFGSAPLASGTELVKCSMLQFETAAETGSPAEVSISDVDLHVVITNPVGASCPSPSSRPPALKVRTDQSQDWKKMVALEDSDVSGGLAGKCVYVDRDPRYIEPAGLTTTAACYAAGEMDDAT